MIIRLAKLFLTYLLFIYICISFSSCLSLKEIRLFQDIPDSTKLSSIKLPKFIPTVVHPGELLSISIVTVDQAATTSLTLANSFITSLPIGGASGGGTATISSEGGFLVDKDGNIEMPELGKIKVEGLNLDEVKATVKKRALDFFKDPIVLIRSRNLKLTILGEVQRPGIYNVINDKITIIDFLALSGDFTTYAKRDNVLLLRQNDDNTFSTIRLDIKNVKVLKSQYYYLQNNDVIYVDPNPGKAYSEDVIFTRNLSYFTLATGLLTTLLVLIKR